MKKFFKRISLVLLMGTLGMSVTSCDSDVLTLVSQLIGGIFNQGETYTYQGNSKATAMIYVGDQENQNSTSETAFTNQTVQIVARQGQNAMWPTSPSPTSRGSRSKSTTSSSTTLT